MGETTKPFRFFHRAMTEQEEERQTLLAGLNETRRLIHQAYSGFNSTPDPDLIESYVFEISALQSRYSYLLRRLRALEDRADTARQGAG